MREWAEGPVGFWRKRPNSTDNAHYGVAPTPLPYLLENPFFKVTLVQPVPDSSLPPYGSDTCSYSLLWAPSPTLPDFCFTAIPFLF